MLQGYENHNHPNGHGSQGNITFSNAREIAVPRLYVNLVMMDSTEKRIPIYKGKDVAFSLMKFCIFEGINDIALIEVLKRRIIRGVQRLEKLNKLERDPNYFSEIKEVDAEDFEQTEPTSTAKKTDPDLRGSILIQNRPFQVKSNSAQKRSLKRLSQNQNINLSPHKPTQPSYLNLEAKKDYSNKKKLKKPQKKKMLKRATSKVIESNTKKFKQGKSSAGKRKFQKFGLGIAMPSPSYSSIKKNLVDGHQFYSAQRAAYFPSSNSKKKKNVKKRSSKNAEGSDRSGLEGKTKMAKSIVKSKRSLIIETGRESRSPTYSSRQQKDNLRNSGFGNKANTTRSGASLENIGHKIMTPLAPTSDRKSVFGTRQKLRLSFKDLEINRKGANLSQNRAERGLKPKRERRLKTNNCKSRSPIGHQKCSKRAAGAVVNVMNIRNEVKKATAKLKQIKAAKSKYDDLNRVKEKEALSYSSTSRYNSYLYNQSELGASINQKVNMSHVSKSPFRHPAGFRKASLESSKPFEAIKPITVSKRRDIRFRKKIKDRKMSNELNFNSKTVTSFKKIRTKKSKKRDTLQERSHEIKPKKFIRDLPPPKYKSPKHQLRKFSAAKNSSKHSSRAELSNLNNTLFKSSQQTLLSRKNTNKRESANSLFNISQSNSQASADRLNFSKKASPQNFGRKKPQYALINDLTQKQKNISMLRKKRAKNAHQVSEALSRQSNASGEANSADRHSLRHKKRIFGERRPDGRSQTQIMTHRPLDSSDFGRAVNLSTTHATSTKIQYKNSIKSQSSRMISNRQRKLNVDSLRQHGRGQEAGRGVLEGRHIGSDTRLTSVGDHTSRGFEMARTFRDELIEDFDPAATLARDNEESFKPTKLNQRVPVKFKILKCEAAEVPTITLKSNTIPSYSTESVRLKPPLSSSKSKNIRESVREEERRDPDHGKEISTKVPIPENIEDSETIIYNLNHDINNEHEMEGYEEGEGNGSKVGNTHFRKPSTTNNSVSLGEFNKDQADFQEYVNQQYLFKNASNTGKVVGKRKKSLKPRKMNCLEDVLKAKKNTLKLENRITLDLKKKFDTAFDTMKEQKKRTQSAKKKAKKIEFGQPFSREDLIGAETPQHQEGKTNRHYYSSSDTMSQQKAQFQDRAQAGKSHTDMVEKTRSFQQQPEVEIQDVILARIHSNNSQDLLLEGRNPFNSPSMKEFDTQYSTRNKGYHQLEGEMPQPRIHLETDRVEVLSQEQSQPSYYPSTEITHSSDQQIMTPRTDSLHSNLGRLISGRGELQVVPELSETLNADEESQELNIQAMPVLNQSDPSNVYNLYYFNEEGRNLQKNLEKLSKSEYTTIKAGSLLEKKQLAQIQRMKQRKSSHSIPEIPLAEISQIKNQGGVETYDVKLMRTIFEIMDSDNDNLLSAQNIDLEKIPTGMLEHMEQILFEIYRSKKAIDFLAFVQIIRKNKLYKKLETV